MRFILTLLSLAISTIVFAQKSTGIVKLEYFRDSIVSMQKHYGADGKLDSLKTFYKSGNIDEVFYYKDSKIDGVCLKYATDGKKLTTWVFEEGLLVDHITHRLEYNLKNKQRIESASNRLEELNNKSKREKLSMNELIQRADLRFTLNYNILALETYLRVVRSLHPEKTHPKVKSRFFDRIAAIYASYEMDNWALHYRHKAVIASPEDTRLLYNLGANLYEVKAYRLSINYLGEVKKKWKNHPFSNWLLAAMHTDLEEYEKAFEYVNLAFKKEENLDKYSSNKAENDLRTIRGLLYHKLGESEKGIADLENALSINENNSRAYRNLGVIYHNMGQFNTACTLLEKAQELGYSEKHDQDDLEFYLEQSCSGNSSIEIQSLAKKPFIYPNPVIDILNVKNLDEANFQFDLYDYNRQLVKSGTGNGSSINMTGLESGLYILKIYAKDEVHTFKIIKS
ncbi:Por secretion system C-terminal sorting domain-containing protein [Nonlabens sp. Hel1_33_55]|uniref:T9SS type A sorting domain-containing protein n=1 Tax=Nonlabens sp. Hel1_33_55 TaxID=1336802 RepID=UPI000875E664|nr:T9SS type A sorting domain-containing protein [Nonlabens sp. Hel1_33_55]SCX99797.1 Por secretion system C-terminal sorting domain-containing protein [Nonlabens sp. Hel1_33_55]